MSQSDIDSVAAAAAATWEWSRLVEEGWAMAAQLSVSSSNGELGETSSAEPAETKQRQAESEVVIEDIAEEEQQQAEEADSSDDEMSHARQRKAWPGRSSQFERQLKN